MTLQVQRLPLADRLAALRADLLAHAKVVEDSLDQYQRNVFEYIVGKLLEMENECRSGELRPRDQRHRYVARTVVETDPAVLPPDFGGKLIEIEDAYRKL